MSRTTTLAVAVLVAGALGALLAARSLRARPQADGPSVVVVLWDTVRADRMSLYGHDRPTTPNLDAFARGAVVYERAISAAMWTVPAHASLFTGLAEGSHGARVGWLWLDGHHVTLAEHFAARGYATFAWSSNPYLSEQTNLLQGFEDVAYAWRGEVAARAGEATRGKLLPDDRSVELSPGWRTAGHGKGWPAHLTATKDSAPVAFETLLSWIDRLPEGRPFVAYVNLLEAHHPRIPSAEARAAVADPETVARALATDASLFRVMAAMEGQASIAADELAAMAATYDATLWDLDRATGALFDALRVRGRLDDTVVVVTSDHGENLGEHGMHEHRWDLHQSLVHVPLVIRYPAKLPPQRVNTPVSTAHLFGTLLALTGEPAPAVSHGLPALGEEPVFTELTVPTKRLPEIEAAFPHLPEDRWSTRWQAAIDGRWKLLRPSVGAPMLFDLDTDPGERVDRSAEHPAEAQRLHDALVAWSRQRPRYDKRRRTPGDRPGNPMFADASAAEQLKALGYAEPDEEEE